MNKSKFFLSFSVVLLVILCSCTMKKENSLSDATRIAKEDFHVETIYFTCAGTSQSEFMNETTKQYPIYVIGENHIGEEVFIIVPALKSQKAYTGKWPFNKPFKMIIDELNATEDEIVCSENDYGLIKLVDNFEIMVDYYSELDLDRLDFKMMIVFRNHYIVQIDGIIQIYAD